MNITFVNDSIGYDGAEIMTMVVAQGLRSKGHVVSVINLNIHNDRACQNTEGIKYKSGHCTS